MKALILAAGYGTRLYPLVKDTAKALLKIHNKPLIDYTLKKIENLSGLDEVMVVTNEKFYADFVLWAKGHEGKFRCPITIINDKTESPDDRLGSIGDIAFVLNNQKIADDLLIIGGDNLFDYELDTYLDFSRKNPQNVSIGLYNISSLEEAKLFGVVEITQEGKIISFQEKPAQPKSTLIAMCCYYLPKATLNTIADYLSDVGKSDTAGDYIRWLHEKNAVYGFKFNGTWYDIGSIESYRKAEEEFK